MGQATINSGGPTGLYNVKISKYTGNASARQAAIASRLSALVGLISTATANVNAALSDLASAQNALDAAIAAMVDETTRKAVTDATANVIDKQQAVTRARMVYAGLVAEQQSIQKEQVRLTTAMGDESLAAWCADLTENLAVGATVGTAEINGEDGQIIILPGGSTTNALGKLQPTAVATSAGVFYNKAILPAWQKWKPTYRIGTIISIDYTSSKCDVGITSQYSEEQGLPINQAGVAWKSTEAAIPGFDEFAAKYPDFPLVTNTADTTLTMTAKLMRDMAAVQADVQNRFKYKLDKDQYGVLEKWDFMQEGGAGDCEDHSLVKAKKLLDLGYPASAIKIEVGKMPNGEGHAWLVVQTDQGDFILDNNYLTVVKSSVIPYTQRRRQTGITWGNTGIKLSDVPIEYMDGVNADAFIVGDRVVVAFTNQDWNQPKVIGFETNPRPGYALFSFVNNPYVTNRTICKYSLEGVLAETIITTVSGTSYVSMAGNKTGSAVCVVIHDTFGLPAPMTLVIDYYISQGKTSIVYDLWQGYISTYFAAIPKDYCSVHRMGEAFFDDYGLIYIPLAVYGGTFFIYSLLGFIVVNPADGSLVGEYWHNYGGSILAYPDGPSGGYVANGKVYLADMSDGIDGYPIVRILNQSNYSLDSTISLSGTMDTYAHAVCATADRIYAVYYSSENMYLKIFDETTHILQSTILLKSSGAWPSGASLTSASIFVVTNSLIIVLSAPVNSTTTRFNFTLAGVLIDTIEMTYKEYEQSFTLAKSNIVKGGL